MHFSSNKRKSNAVLCSLGYTIEQKEVGQKMKKYYLVEAKCGHVGRHRYYKGCFFITSLSAQAAAQYVKSLARVKRDHKDCILDVIEISLEEYLAGKEKIALEPYWQCRSKYQQKQQWEHIKGNVYPETALQQKYNRRFRKKREDASKEEVTIYIKKKRLRDPHKFFKLHPKEKNL